MSKKANPAVVGGFVLGAVVITIIGAMLLGGGAFMQERFTGIMYFDESISGLDVGAPVDFQGVRIGTVTGVRMEMDTNSDGTVYRPVTFQIEFNRIHFRGGRVARGKEIFDRIERLVQEQGMRARLASQSLLTGRLKVELGYFPGTPVERKNRDVALWEMPTLPSTMQRVAQDLSQLPLGDMVVEAHEAVKRLSNMLDPEKIGATYGNLNQTLTHLSGMLVKLEERIDPLLLSLTRTSDQAGAFLNPDSDLRAEIDLLISEVRATSRSLRQLTDHLEQHPESLLWGK
jgi:paraquat-inducible protein B